MSVIFLLFTEMLDDRNEQQLVIENQQWIIQYHLSEFFLDLENIFLCNATQS